MENLAHYVVRASFSQERMPYIPEEANVVYRSKDGKNEKTFDALEWLAAMCSHVPNKGEQMVRYYGYCSPAVGAGSGSTEEVKRGGIGPLHPAARGIIRRVPQELGKVYPPLVGLSRK
jgi:hypothetical protein